MTLLVRSETRNLQRVFCSLFLEVPPPPPFPKGRSLCQAFLADTVETGTKNRYVIEATGMFREESLGKIKFRAFPKCVGPQILSLESVD